VVTNHFQSIVVHVEVISVSRAVFENEVHSSQAILCFIRWRGDVFWTGKDAQSKAASQRGADAH